jgi:hypothetical protein
VAHFVRHHSPNCTFCDIADNRDVENETPLHLFLTCPSVEVLVENFFKWLCNDETFDFARQEFFVSFNRGDLSAEKNSILTVASKLLIKFIWDCKQRYCKPNLAHCKVSISMELNSIADTNPNFRRQLFLSGIQLLN